MSLCCCRRRREKILYFDADGRSCSFTSVQGVVERSVDAQTYQVEELFLKPASNESVLIGDSPTNLSSIPLEHLAKIEEWAKNAGIPIHSEVDRTEGFDGSHDRIPGPLRLRLHRAWNVPKMDCMGATDAYVTIKVFAIRGQERMCLAMACSRVLVDEVHPVWNQTLELPNQDGPNAVDQEVHPATWDLNNTEVHFAMHDQDQVYDDVIGECSLPLLDVIERTDLYLMLWDKYGEAVVGPSPHMPCEIHVQIDSGSFPQSWPRPANVISRYPCHAFMMTRGTRGDVQPFVALARGLAEQLGWLITICTEVRWKRFVKSHANVSRGRIRFRPSGGDTEARMQTPISQWALSSKTELLQLAILAWAEAEFFSSSTVFLTHVQAFKNNDQPVDVLIFGLTVAQIAALISEKLNVPLVGFILQPSCIPSTDVQWKAVQDIRSHYFRWIDDVEKFAFTSHKSLERLKHMAEHNWFCTFQVAHLRNIFGLPPMPIDSVWKLFARSDTPLIVPIREGTFDRPHDWPAQILLTDFIFLRSRESNLGDFGGPLEGFTKAARAADAKICLMTFSSMPVPRRTTLTCAVKMLEQCRFNLRFLYVGRRQNDEVPQNMKEKADQYVAEGRLLEVEKADFSILFGCVDCFIVHGGLGTTVEALRKGKPCVVTGPLLLDQRFWGSVCTEKGVGPSSVHIDQFEDSCVDFVNGALDPEDPYGWQDNARNPTWGEDEDDGVKANVDRFSKLWHEKLSLVAIRGSSNIEAVE